MGVAEYKPPSILYSTLNPDTGVTEGKLNAELQVLPGVARTGAAGNTTKFEVSAQIVGCAAVKIACQHPGVVGLKTPEPAFIVPPPFTVHVPPGGTTFSVNVTDPPPTQEFGVVATALVYTMTGSG